MLRHQAVIEADAAGVDRQMLDREIERLRRLVGGRGGRGDGSRLGRIGWSQLLEIEHAFRVAGQRHVGLGQAHVVDVIDAAQRFDMREGDMQRLGGNKRRVLFIRDAQVGEIGGTVDDDDGRGTASHRSPAKSPRSGRWTGGRA